MNSAAGRIQDSTEPQDINIRQDVLPAAALALKPSAVFTTTSRRRRHRRYVASNPYFWANLKERLINLLLPGIVTRVPPKKRTPSEVLGCLVPRRRPAGPKPSDVFCANKPTPERRFTSQLVSIAPEPEALIFHQMTHFADTNEGHFISGVVSNPPKLKLGISRRTLISTISEERAPAAGLFRPADMEASLQITVLRHYALHSGIEMPSRTIPVPVIVTDPLLEDDEHSDNEEE